MDLESHPFQKMAQKKESKADASYECLPQGESPLSTSIKSLNHWMSIMKHRGSFACVESFSRADPKYCMNNNTVVWKISLRMQIKTWTSSSISVIRVGLFIILGLFTDTFLSLGIQHFGINIFFLFFIGNHKPAKFFQGATWDNYLEPTNAKKGSLWGSKLDHW